MENAKKRERTQADVIAEIESADKFVKADYGKGVRGYLIGLGCERIASLYLELKDAAGYHTYMLAAMRSFARKELSLRDAERIASAIGDSRSVAYMSLINALSIINKTKSDEANIAELRREIEEFNEKDIGVVKDWGK